MYDEVLQRSNIMIVDDQAVNLLPLEFTLRKNGFTEIVTITDPRAVLPTFNAVQPDIILLDLNMPYLDGFEVIEQLAPLIGANDYLPIFVITADLTPHAKHRALTTLAKDFLTKPFDTFEAFLRIRNLLETRYQHRQLQSQNQQLLGTVQQRSRELASSQVETLARLAHAAEYRDDYNGEHTRRVGNLSSLLARAMGLPQREIELVHHAALAHDIGKIAIPDYILHKPEALTPDEYEVVKAHTTLGARMLAEGNSDLVRTAQSIALSHHERWDGTGYPEGLSGAAIPLAGRIVAVAEYFETCVHDRSYKKAHSLQGALQEIVSRSGTWFDPAIVSALLVVLDGTEHVPASAEAIGAPT